MERLLVLAVDEPATEPPGNASHHRYEFILLSEPAANAVAPGVGQILSLGEVRAIGKSVGEIQFQRGPFDADGSTPGTLSNAVLAALIDHLQGFQGGPLANRETALAITKLQEALFWLRARADERAARNVLGTMEK